MGSPLAKNARFTRQPTHIRPLDVVNLSILSYPSNPFPLGVEKIRIDHDSRPFPSGGVDRDGASIVLPKHALPPTVGLYIKISHHYRDEARPFECDHRPMT